MNKLKYQNSRRVDRFKTATSKVLEIAKNISQRSQIDDKGTSNDIRLTEELKSYTNCTRSAADKCTDIALERNKQSSPQKSSSSSESSSLTFEEASLSSLKTFKRIEDTEGDDRLIKSISTLYQLHQERKKALEDINKVPLQHLQNQFHQLAAKDISLRRIDGIRELNTHLKKVILQVPQLKQKLRKPIFQDVWDVHISHHKFIVQFFEMAKTLMTELEANTETFQWLGLHDANKSLDMKSFLSLLQIAIIQLEKYFGSIAEFQRTFNLTFKDQ